MTDLEMLGNTFANLAWYRRTKDLVPLFDPIVHHFANSLLKILAQLQYNISVLKSNTAIFIVCNLLLYNVHEYNATYTYSLRSSVHTIVDYLKLKGVEYVVGLVLNGVVGLVLIFVVGLVLNVVGGGVDPHAESSRVSKQVGQRSSIACHSHGGNGRNGGNGGNGDRDSHEGDGDGGGGHGGHSGGVGHGGGYAGGDEGLDLGQHCSNEVLGAEGGGGAGLSGGVDRAGS